MSEKRPAKTSLIPDRDRAPNGPPLGVEQAGGPWERNERIRTAELRADAQRPMGELLESGIALSRMASELAAAPRRSASLSDDPI